MPDSVASTDPYDQMQSAMLNPNELVWWLTDIEAEHLTIWVESRRFWEKVDNCRAASLDDFKGWRPTIRHTTVMAGTIVSVGLDFESRNGSKYRTFYLILVVASRRKLQKVYLSDIASLGKPLKQN